MVGIVVVAHNPKLSQEIINFCMELKNSDFMLENGGGLENDDGYGTCPEVITKAIRKAEQGDGVVILCDLGSSVSNAETAKERLKNEIRVEIVDAPIVEGTLIAMSINDGKTSLEDILEELKDLKNFNKV